ncbi:MAG TPA: Holliday junction resolvase RuvX [Candidatus Limnocylindria bacterium]|nr:Holliday junction resolvase RuvX [Candidatus Limnocylindria bacterium]
MRYLALDVGDRRIGLAVGDDAFGLTRALPTLRRSRRLATDIERIASIVRGEEVGALVIGLPLTLRGDDSRQTERARRFAASCAPIGLPVTLYDERNTTVEAARRGEADPDAGAARVLLEDFLSARP